jgi:16S rRNA (uracil1498-N3)-methyltransferase
VTFVILKSIDMKLFFGQIFPEIQIDSDEQQHITKVLRMREGEEIFVTDGNGNIANGSLVFEGKSIFKHFRNQRKSARFFPEASYRHCADKNIDRIEFFVEKAVEMGISEISLILTEKPNARISILINYENRQLQPLSKAFDSIFRKSMI